MRRRATSQHLPQRGQQPCQPGEQQPTQEGFHGLDQLQAAFTHTRLVASTVANDKPVIPDVLHNDAGERRRSK